MHNIRPVILAGGKGKRLWPKSRAGFPKQFTNLVGEETLFQAAVRRVSGHGFSAPVVVTAEPFRFIVLEQLEQIGVRAAAILIEPDARNTAPSVAAALAWISQKDPEAEALITPSDHVIQESEAFRAMVRQVSGTDGIKTFGIAPTRPETGFGWLELADHSDGEPPYRLKRFVEKPSKADAESMLASGRFLWNAGIFFASLVEFQSAYAQVAPHIHSLAKEAFQKAQHDLGFTRLDQETWAKMDAVSIDHAVMEQLNELFVVPWKKGWSDLGSWDAVWRQKGDGAVTEGSAIAIDCEDTFLSSSAGQPLVGIGLSNIVAVAFPDAVLVTTRQETQNVGQAVELLAAKGYAQAEEFPRDHRPWGWFETLAIEDRFRVKRLVVKPGARLSLQSHQRRAEHWVVVEGTAQITIGETERRLSENQSIYVPVGTRHRLENKSKSNLVIIEVQTGAYLEEDDIERYEDDYSRE